MKAKTAIKALLTTLHGGSRTCAMAQPVPPRKPVLTRFMPQLCAAALVLPAFRVQAGVTFTTLHSFKVFSNGANPWSALVQGSDGNFYGTTFFGGTNGGNGTVFKISTNGALTSLYSFTGGNDGSKPDAGLVQGSDGSLYGTTIYGGTNDAGTVFKISTNGALTSLYSFTGGNDGSGPEAGLVQGRDSNFYGTTTGGGTNGGNGTVFKISTNGALTSLYSFTGTNDGARPYAGLVQGNDGSFYGTTWGGGTNGGQGTVFKINTNGVLTTLYSFAGGNDGAYPFAGLVHGSDGNFYGTTSAGAYYSPPLGEGYGTVFKISTNGSLTTLYSFTGTNDGGSPNGLVQGRDGNFNGTTGGGGTYTNQSSYGCGTVFKISANGVLTSLYSFTGTNDGGGPNGLVQGSDGNFYGTTWGGGTNGIGTVFKISTNGALTSLCSFTGNNDGSEPYAGLVQGNDGNLYGTTEYDGSNYGGTVFKIRPCGALTSLYSFTGRKDGSNLRAALAQGSDGNLYGTTYQGGAYTNRAGQGYGTVFKISTNGALTSLYSFTGTEDGAGPNGLVQGRDGNFYGTTDGGLYPPAGSDGTVFKIGTNGILTILYAFTGGNDGSRPSPGLVQGRDGNFYGTTVEGGAYTDQAGQFEGTVFKISTNGALTSLYSFTGTNDGAFPNGLVQGRDGNFYGTTDGGGAYFSSGLDYGTVFKISTNGALTTLYSFTGGNDGAEPRAGLVQASDGNFYGTTYGGGASNAGTVFKISSTGALTSLYSFTGGHDGWNLEAGLVQGRDGNFYGTTSGGGQGGAGTVFQLSVVQSAPAFQALTLTNRTVSLTWGTEAGGRYQLQYNSDLSSSNWTSLGSAITATGATLSTTDSATNGPRRFYRLVLLP
jgi:uncharacterized repeat protein (TIGR03803 family)